MKLEVNLYVHAILEKSDLQTKIGSDKISPSGDFARSQTRLFKRKSGIFQNPKGS
jgi:hypothetical protein